jgi:pimeloyl-ACP methyl ester carboxylesterase
VRVETVGSAESWKHVAESLPRGELRLIEGAGHMPWFDDSGSKRAAIRDLTRLVASLAERILAS